MQYRDIELLNGDCLEILKILPENSVDSLVTDPPAGISFMGKDWDKDKGGRDNWIEWMSEVMAEALRVLKPGGHGLVWAIPRTSHWTATALENAGFEIRDIVVHLFGSGFPKSQNIGKAIDKAAGAVGHSGKRFNAAGDGDRSNGGDALRSDHPEYIKPQSITSEAKQWDGWGTALKPASEHWILIRKPLSEKTIAKNVIKWGTGGINIDGCRVEIDSNDPNHRPGTNDRDESPNSIFGAGNKRRGNLGQGRFPANLVLSGEAPEMLDKQSGECKTGAFKRKASNNTTVGPSGYKTGPRTEAPLHKASTGGASRFFYCAKASKSERGQDNNHPTVKALKLMEYLIKLITPPEGIVLDPFMGSGSTGVAAKNEGFRFIGIEENAEYYDIADKRLG